MMHSGHRWLGIFSADPDRARSEPRQKLVRRHTTCERDTPQKRLDPRPRHESQSYSIAMQHSDLSDKSFASSRCEAHHCFADTGKPATKRLDQDVAEFETGAKI